MLWKISWFFLTYITGQLYDNMINKAGKKGNEKSFTVNDSTIVFGILIMSLDGLVMFSVLLRRIVLIQFEVFRGIGFY